MVKQNSNAYVVKWEEDVRIPIRSGNTTATCRGGDVVSLGVVASSISGGSVGIGHESGSITLPEVINDWMSPQPSGSSEEENEPPATHILTKILNHNDCLYHFKRLEIISCGTSSNVVKFIVNVMLEI
ncbi:hypothetical protein Tco_0508453 [Tanacetum coccineum]